MNPNSANQLWSRWTLTVTPAFVQVRSFEEVKVNVTRFVRKAFGSAGEMRITQTQRGYVVDIRVEGHPVHDPTLVAYYTNAFDRFFKSGFGPKTVVSVEAKLEAGSRQDGTPPDQLVMLPPIPVDLG
jgi:hypothetical protein